MTTTAAVCLLVGQIVGTILLKQNGDSINIQGEIRNLSDGKHGFHIHQYGDLRDSCKSAGPHFNPFNKTHGAPTDTNRHVGDLGNIVSTNGVAQVDITDSLIKFSGDASIIGKAIVVHSGEDDLGTGNNEESKKTGNAGSRVACCVIGEAKPDA